MSSEYDILIAGGGMVGATLARALSPIGLRVAVVEAVAHGAATQPSYDDRVIALSHGSRLILQGIGCWDALRSEAEPIRRIHISDRGHFGITRLDCRDSGIPALGYVASARAIGDVLLTGEGGQADVDWLCPANITDFSAGPEQVELSLMTEQGMRKVTTRLLVAADGGESMIRKRLQVPLQHWNYGQSAVIANLTPGIPHANVAYERFTDSGPLAMLPMSDGRCSLVWTQRDAAVPEVLSWTDQEFLRHLQQRFGHRLGRLERVGKRVAYPLRLLRVKKMFGPRTLLIGNAAHTLHPIAGQGLNLGLRDVSLLAELLMQAHGRGEDPGNQALLRRYAEGRSPDQRNVALITDLLARLFVNPLSPIKLGRNLGLLGLDLLPPMKQALIRRFMGLHGHQPRLSRGLPLSQGH